MYNNGTKEGKNSFEYSTAKPEKVAAFIIYWKGLEN